VGPWFKYVTSAMTINSLLLKPFPSLLKLLHKGPHDATPSALACGVTVLGTAMELSLAPLCVLLPAVGVPVVCLFHFYIFCMVPFASVMEWNVFCVLSAIYHFQLNTVSMPMTLSPLLAVRIRAACSHPPTTASSHRNRAAERARALGDGAAGLLGGGGGGGAAGGAALSQAGAFPCRLPTVRR
jgi:hypothetical protein